MFSILSSLDVWILEIINHLPHSILLNNLGSYVSYMGLIFFGFIIAVVLYLFDEKKGKNVAIKLIIALLLTYVVVQSLKYLIMRPRPYTQLSTLIVLATEVDYSFPSGHTAMSTTLAYVLGDNYGYMKFFMVIPLLVGLSRLYLGVHYPSDVIGGFLCGLIIAYLSEYLFRNKKFLN